MRSRRYGFNEKKIARFIREGRGQGTGKDYRPWLQVNDVSSLGREHRVYWCKTGREHHFLSDNEYRAFLIFAWSDEVVDIREQFPLDRRETMKIASELGVRHPMDKGIVLFPTTDLLVTVKNGKKLCLAAYAIKEEQDLSKKRVAELLEIERCYWSDRDVPWKILTNREVKTSATRNLEWIYGLDGSYPIGPQEEQIHWCLWSYQTMNPHCTITAACNFVDNQLIVPPGTSLSVL